MKRFVDRVEEMWCVNMHAQVMWPYRGRYLCRTCLREYPVNFEAPAYEAEPRQPVGFAAAGIVARRA